MSDLRSRPDPSPAICLAVCALLLLLCGAGLAAGGLWLVLLGGAWYYLVAGLALLAAGILLLLRRPEALWLHAAILAASLLWALWEAGLDWWPLASRGSLLVLLGLLLLLPRVARPLRREGREGAVAGGRRAIAAVLLAVAIVGAAAILYGPEARRGAAVALPQPAADAATTGAAAGAALTDTATTGAVPPPGDWPAYGRTQAGQRWSPLAQITPANVQGLEKAWEYRTGDLRGRPGDPEETTFQVTPLKIGDALYLCTPHQIAIALDPQTGAELWRFDPQIPADLAAQHMTCRGLAYHPPPAGAEGAEAGACAARLFLPTANARLIALDPQTGRPCPGFGEGGQIDLWRNMPNVRPGGYYSTSPPAVGGGLVIVGGTVLDNVSVQETSGVVRAFDAMTGELVWNWDLARPEQTAPLPPGETYTPSTPNVWSVMSVDEELGMVYLPLGNQPPDQLGMHRSEAVERFASSVVALDLTSGRLRWVFQTVHHDLWDYDVPSQPGLVDLTIGGQRVPALVQPTKQGELFVLDRRTGTPLLPVREEPAPQGAVAGEWTAPTQPVSALSYAPPPLTGADMWGIGLFDQLACRIAFHRLRYEGRYTPPSLQGSIVHPGNFGVFNWGGVAIDPERQLVFSSPAYLAFVSRLLPRDDDESLVANDASPQGSLPALNENFGASHAVSLKPFLSPLGLPCQQPPWGHVSAADLRSGRILWQRRNGTVEDAAPLPLPLELGVPDLGGPVLTASGLAFLSGTLDYYLRAYDVATGRQLWQARLPAGGQATPMTYEGADGRQYVLAVAGGHGSLGTKAGDFVIAYALPQAGRTGEAPAPAAE